MALDEDGSREACHHAGGPTNQCATSLKLIATEAHPGQLTTPSRHCVPVDPEKVAYVMIPAAVPKMPWLRPNTPKIDAAAYQRQSGVDFGDFGVAIFKDKTVPVVVADGGPAYKLGERSTATLKAVTADGHARPISSGVTVVLFPRTGLKPDDLGADTFGAVVESRGRAYFAALTGELSSGPCAQR